MSDLTCSDHSGSSLCDQIGSNWKTVPMFDKQTGSMLEQSGPLRNAHNKVHLCTFQLLSDLIHIIDFGLLTLTFASANVLVEPT